MKKPKVNRPTFTFDIPKPTEEPRAENELQETEETPPAEPVEAVKTAEVNEHKENETEKDHQPQDQEEPAADGQREAGLVGKYRKREPKYKTHVAYNVRIPKDLRQDIDRIAKKLGYTGKDKGFYQQFTIDALTIHVEKAKKELGLD